MWQTLQKKKSLTFEDLQLKLSLLFNIQIHIFILRNTFVQIMVTDIQHGFL
jgi:hypothetical protein